MRITPVDQRKRYIKLRASVTELMEPRLLFTTYYVDTNSPAASDNNAGTSLAAPLKTINQALTLVSNDNKTTQSDTVLIRGGVYHEQPNVWPNDSGASATSRTVISAYVDPTTGQRESVYIDGATPITGTWIQDGTSNRWYINNFQTMTSGVWVDWSGSNDGASLQQIGTYNDGFADERTVTGSGTSDMTSGTYYGDLANNRLYVYLKDGSNPNLHSLEYASQSHDIYQPGAAAAGGGYTYAQNIDFVGLRLRHADAYNSMGQDSGCAMYTTNNERLIDCDIEWNEGTGVILRGTSQMIDCVASNNGRNGVSAQGQGFLISGGQYDSNYWRLNTDASEAGIKVISNTPVLWGDIEGAEIANNYGKGIWFDTTFENSVVSHISGNYIHDNQDDGIDLEASKNFEVVNNVITNNQNDGIFLNAVENARIENNTLVGNHGVATIELDGGSRSQGSVYPGTIATLNDTIENNIIANNFSVYDLDVPTSANGSSTINGISSDYNLFYHQGGPLKFTDGGDYIGWAKTPSTLAGWQTDSGQDIHSVMADPMFISGGAGALAYEIGSNSPVVGIGANRSSAYTTDYNTTARPAANYDMGAFQHSTTATGIAGAVVVNTDPSVWVDDQLPDNAAMTTPDAYSNMNENRFWQWDSQNSYSGSVSVDSTAASGPHRQFFTGATARAVATTDNLFAYVWINPQNMPKQIMLEWQDSSGSWAHQAYWGTSNLIGAGVDGSSAAHNMGALPGSGAWVELSVPASTVGLAGKSITGFSFDLYDGRALLDNIGNGASSAASVSQPTNNASISGQVFRDNNSDGTLNNGEVGLAGRTVFLDLNGNGILDARDPTATTNSSGAYSFTKLAPGTYTVRQMIPAGFVASTSSDAAYTLTLQPTTTAVQNLGEFPTTFKSSIITENYTIGLSTNQQTVEIWDNQPESAAPTYEIAKAQLPTASFAAGSFGASLTVDFSNGAPLTTGQLSFDGGTAGGSLVILGATSSANAFKLGANSVSDNSISMNFANVASVSITGGSANDSLDLSGWTVPVVFNGLTGSDSLNVNTGTYAFTSDPQAMTANLQVNVASGASVSFAAGVAGAGISTYHLAGLKVAAGGLALMSPAVDSADRSLLVVNSLSFAGTASSPAGVVNLTNNDMIIRNGNAGALSALLGAGYASGTWAGAAGITSSTAEFDPQSMMAIGMSTGVAGQFDSQTITTGDVVMKYTEYCDANLDGTVNATDYNVLSAASNSGATGWWNGDFNYDGVVDGSDFTLIDNAFTLESVPLNSIADTGTTGGTGITTTGAGTTTTGTTTKGTTGATGTTTGTTTTASSTTALGTGSNNWTRSRYNLSDAVKKMLLVRQADTTAVATATNLFLAKTGQRGHGKTQSDNLSSPVTTSLANAA